MKFCINCGAKLNDSDLFCMECGTKCSDVVLEDKTEPLEEAKPLEEVEEEKQEIKNDKEERLKALEEERKRLVAEIEEEKRQEELERQRQEELEREKQAELERQKQEELEREKQAELERQKQEELERQRQAEIERQRQEELEKEANAKIETVDDVIIPAIIPIPEVKDTETEAKVEDEVKEEVKQEVKQEKEDASSNSKLSDEENLQLIKHSLFFTGLILILSIIYWFIGAFFFIHVAIRIAFIFICMGAMALPIYETVKYVIASIKAKKFNLFTLVTLGICQILLFVLFFISISVAAS